jgi:hypothetical protein
VDAVVNVCVRGMSVGLVDGDDVSADVGSAGWTNEGAAVG